MFSVRCFVASALVEVVRLQKVRPPFIFSVDFFSAGHVDHVQANCKIHQNSRRPEASGERRRRRQSNARSFADLPHRCTRVPMLSRAFRSALADCRLAVASSPASLSSPLRSSHAQRISSWGSQSAARFNSTSSNLGTQQSTASAANDAVSEEPSLEHHPSQMHIEAQHPRSSTDSPSSTPENPNASPASTSASTTTTTETTKPSSSRKSNGYRTANESAIHYKLPVPPAFDAPLKITPSLASSLPYLTTQTPHYISAHLHARPYLVTAGDTLRLPFLMPNVEPGDVIRLNRASILGSRDFTLRGTPYIDERMFECRARVVGVEAEPMRIKEKTKRRQRHVRRIRSKHKYTILKIMEVKVKELGELITNGAEITSQDTNESLRA